MKSESKKTAPAYTTYTAFTNLIKDLRSNGMPSHITRSVVKGSNSGKAMMMASLKYLSLIDKDSCPTERLTQLIENESNYSNILKELLEEQYSFLFSDGFDIKTTTTEKVSELFQKQGAGGSTISKGMAFFLSAAKAAGIEISSRVKAPAIQKSPAKRKPRDPISKTPPGDSDPEVDVIPDGMERITVSLRDMEDGIIYFPKDMEDDDARRAVKMTTFILNQFYGIEDRD